MKKDKYDYDRFGSKAKRVGQAVSDILSKEQPVYTAGDILDEYGKDYVRQFEESLETGIKLYKDPFHIFVLSAKEMWAVNMVRNWFIPRQTAPNALDVMTAYPNHTKTLYRVNSEGKTIDILWSLPGLPECKVILRNPEVYDPVLVTWVKSCMEGKLESAS